jgi:hypothetical protein
MRETPGSLDEMVSRDGHQNAENPGLMPGFCDALMIG